MAICPGIGWRFGSEQHGDFNRNRVAFCYGIRSNVEADSGKKYIGFLKDIAARYGLLREGEEDAEIVYRNVFPDIIVHKRGLNSDNLLIIEIKKSSSNISCDYDIEKLKRYTSPEYENTLNYAFGVLVYLGVADKLGDDRIVWFQNGNNMNRSG